MCQVITARSSDPSPGQRTTSLNYFGDASQTSSNGATPGISRHNSHSIRMKPSKTVPSLIITDTSVEDKGSETSQKSLNTTITPKPAAIQLKGPCLTSPPGLPRVTSPTFFNSKKYLSNLQYSLSGEGVESVKSGDLTEDLLQDEDTIILDVRPYASYLSSRLIHSLNVCVPTTLLKRKSFGLHNIIGSMHKTQQEVILLLIDRPNLHFIVYDDSSTLDNCSFHLYQICLKVLNYIREEGKPQWKVSIVQNGISCMNSGSKLMSFAADLSLSPVSPSFGGSQMPSTSSLGLKLKTSPMSVRSNSNSSSPRTANFGVLSFSGFSLPSASDFSMSFASSIKKSTVPAANSVRKSEDDVIHLPQKHGLSKSTVPPWLNSFLDPTSGFKIVNERFLKIEDIENERLENVAKFGSNTLDTPSVQQSCCSHDGNCSPSAPCAKCDHIRYTLPVGIEYGDKNRYCNVWPYEHSRVKILNSPLPLSPNMQPQLPAVAQQNDSGDYFNANYVTVPKISKNRYIATQLPMPATFHDFWRAVWYNKVEVIVCLTQLKEGGVQKADKYWQDHVYESGLEVKLIKEEEFSEPNTTLRTLEVTKPRGLDGKIVKKTIKQIDYKDWPDFGVPPSAESLVKLINLKNSVVSDEYSPIVVHCSAGCGRTGTFITIDALLQLFWSSLDVSSLTTPLVRKSSLRSPFGLLDRQLLVREGEGDDGVMKKFKFWGDDDLIYKTVNILRRQRLSMVQTLSQYVLCYETLLTAINESIMKERIRGGIK